VSRKGELLFTFKRVGGQGNSEELT